MEGRALSRPYLLKDDTAVVPPASPSRFLVPDDEMNDSVGRGDKKAIEVLAQLFHFITALDAVNFQK